MNYSNPPEGIAGYWLKLNADPKIPHPVRSSETMWWLYVATEGAAILIIIKSNTSRSSYSVRSSLVGHSQVSRHGRRAIVKICERIDDREKEKNSGVELYRKPV